jgi:hypothetical protein
MGVAGLRWLACIACACALLACGDDSGGNDGIGADRDAGDAGDRGHGGRGGRGGDEEGGSGGSGHAGSGDHDAAVEDAGPDSGFPPPFLDGGVYSDASEEDAGPPPENWSCPEALWNDGICDCGCTATDYDCNQVGGCVTPGCVSNACQACFTASGSWKPCLPTPSINDWTCGAGSGDEASMGDSVCDCGCGIPDPACLGNGCSEPGCYRDACHGRHGCGAGVTDPADDCNGYPPSVFGNEWTCSQASYGGGDGCDCGCGIQDPDCLNTGCTVARCFVEACTVCHDENHRPYPCAAASAGWDEQTLESAGSYPSQCLGAHFGSDDGCDCGCGGHDPDCGDEGCDEPGCMDAACVRCVDGSSLTPTGCAPAEWVDGTHQCDPDDYGTGNGCDCGCGASDPDCGGAGCTTPGCTDAACDVCNDGGGSYVACPGWTCVDAAALATSECDCGCGVIDPACRDDHRLGCTEPGCEAPVCQYCTDDNGNRAACGGEWTASRCNAIDYGLDGQCDCGCGAIDPDCEDGSGCEAAGCTAPGCEICHDGSELGSCPFWACDEAAYADGEDCDCGCGAHDPDCGTDGCNAPGCGDAQGACEVCHDSYGRPVPCP